MRGANWGREAGKMPFHLPVRLAFHGFSQKPAPFSKVSEV